MPQLQPQRQPILGFQDNPQLQALPQVIQAIRDQVGTGLQQPWGFHEPTITTGAGVEQGLNTTGDVLSDPRNAWMGLGPLSILNRFRRVPHFGRDTGGFNVPTSQLMKQDPHMLKLTELPEHERRQDYLFGRRLENTMADTMQRGPYGRNALPYLEAQDRYAGLAASEQENVNRVLLGRQALEQELLRQSQPGSGGGVPTDMLLRRFGFK